MRVLFAGSPSIAVPSLEALAASRHSVVGVLTNPESAAGRGLKIARTPVAEASGRLFGTSVPVFAFEHLGSEARQAIAIVRPDILVSFAYGRIFGPRFLALFQHGGLNIHPSLLPRWRGSSPIPHAILARDKETGIAIQSIAAELDSGDLYRVERIPLTGRETTASLTDVCARLAAPLLVEVLDAIEAGTARPQPQQGEAVYCGKIAKEDGLLDWSLPAVVLDARIRAFDPWPGTYTFIRNQRLSILEAEPCDPASCNARNLINPSTKYAPGTIIGIDPQRGILTATGEGFLALKRLQLATRKAVSFKDFANGIRDLAGTVLGS